MLCIRMFDRQDFKVSKSYLEIFLEHIKEEVKKLITAQII